jgi:hypothetical protein
MMTIGWRPAPYEEIKSRRAQFLDLVNSQRQSKQVFHITSPSELHRFIAAYCKEEALPENHG